MINRISSFLLVLIVCNATNLWAQLDINRALLRKNNQLIHDSIQFDKFNVTTVDLSSDLKIKLNKLKQIRKALELLKANKEGAHFLTLETISQTKIKNTTTQKTFGLEVQSAGIKVPRIMGLIPQIEPYSFYKDHIHIAGGKYLNPLYNPGFYNIEKTIKDGVILVSFLPKRKRKYLLSGSLKLDSISGQLMYFNGFTSKGINLQIEYWAKKVNETLFPDRLKTTIVVGKKSDVVMNSQSEFVNYIRLKDKLKDRNVIINNDDLLKNDHERIDSFHLDSSYGKHYEVTQRLFNSLHDKEKTQRLYDDLFQIKEGKFPIYFMNLRLNKLLNFNPYEGLRPGLGLETNSRLSKWISVGGYIGYGFKDKTWKASSKIHFTLDKQSKTSLQIAAKDDLYEPGEYRFPFSSKPFGNEGYRKFGLSNIERDQGSQIELSTQYFRWILLNVKTENGRIEPFFDYNYIPLTGVSAFFYSKTSFTARITPREKFLKTYKNYISLGSKYPIFWINYELGNIDAIEYHKFNFKAEKKFRFVAFGDFTMNVLAGFVNKDVPYPFLYNLHGSYRPGTPIINNSFMTMRYNEFIAQKYVVLHVNHNFGKIHTGNNTFNPEPILLHNMGIGTLDNAENHEHVNNVSIEKGYFESGFYLKNLITVQHVVGQTGIGAGMLYRYGPKALPNPGTNVVVKFSVNIEI